MRDRWLYPLGAGVASADLWLLAVSDPLGLLAGLLIPLPLFMVGLAVNARSVVVAGLIAGLMVLLFLQQLGMAAVFLIVYTVPVAWLVLRYSHKYPVAPSTDHPLPTGPTSPTDFTAPPGQLLVQLMTMAVAGMVVCSVLAVILSGSSLQELGLIVLERVRQDWQPYFAAAGDVDGISWAFEIWGLIWPGMVGLSWGWTLIVNGLLARLALSKLGYKLAEKADLRQLELPPEILVIFIAAGAIGLGLSGAADGLLGELGFILTNVAVISSLGIFCAGLAAVHRFAARRVSLVDKRFVLFGFYAALILLRSFAVALVIALGMVILGLHWYRSLDRQRQD